MPVKNAQDAAARAALDVLARGQAGVISAAQAPSEGLSEAAIRRIVDRGEWWRLHRGVFLALRGDSPLHARMWAAHLLAGGRGVVAGLAAGHYWGLVEGDFPQSQPVLLLVPEPLHLRPEGVLLRRVPDPSAWAHPVRTPPVLSVDHAVLGLVGDAQSEAAAVTVVLRACREGLTTPQRLRQAGGLHARLRRRTLLRLLCEEVGLGVMSPLERRYREVARAHGLPSARRQVPSVSVAGAVTYRDVQYGRYGVLVELDGRLGHERESEVFRDQYRDNAATLAGWATLRFGWLAVTAEPCAVVQQVLDLLQLRGWAGQPRRCGPSCTVVARSRRENLVAS